MWLNKPRSAGHTVLNPCEQLHCTPHMPRACGCRIMVPTWRAMSALRRFRVVAVEDAAALSSTLSTSRSPARSTHSSCRSETCGGQHQDAKLRARGRNGRALLSYRVTPTQRAHCNLRRTTSVVPAAC